MQPPWSDHEALNGPSSCPVVAARRPGRARPQSEIGAAPRLDRQSAVGARRNRQQPVRLLIASALHNRRSEHDGEDDGMHRCPDLHARPGLMCRTWLVGRLHASQRHGMPGRWRQRWNRWCDDRERGQRQRQWCRRGRVIRPHRPVLVRRGQAKFRSNVPARRNDAHRPCSAGPRCPGLEPGHDAAQRLPPVQPGSAAGPRTATPSAAGRRPDRG